MTEQETFHTLTLTRIAGIGLQTMLQFYRVCGSATTIIEHRNQLKDIFPEVTQRLENAFKNIDSASRRAEEEMLFMQKHRIECLCINDTNYPSRMKQCDDAPLALFYRGTADLNCKHTLCIVGTRRCSEYGKDICKQLTEEIKRLCPDTLIISGLAYGIDIHAHQGALKHGLATVGVLAHGLDRIYPSSHRQTALEMINNGGLLTEFMSGTNPDKGNFVRRNRIVAGMSDACVVIESANKGGGLITAGIAQDYNREVFAFPGRVNDRTSEGCNELIRKNGAGLVCSGYDIIESLGWSPKAKRQVVEQSLFASLPITEEERTILNLLDNYDGKAVNQLVVEANIPIQKITSTLFELEMKGLVKAMTGGRYRIQKK